MENQIENLKESNLLTKRNIITGLGIIVMLVALGAGIVLIKERQVFRSRAEGGCDLPGDANGDGRVNNADHLIWRSEKNHPGGTTQADFNGDGKVDQKDYQMLRKNLNNICP